MENNNWFKESIIYQIFIDRFAGYSPKKDWDKPCFLGGNIKGIDEKLDYLKNLGINTIWISPFYMTNKYHGYHITDFFSVEPNFGTKGDLKELIKKVHKSEMRIIADFVPNHCSDKHPYFIEAQKNKKSKYYNWFYFKKWPGDYLCFLSINELPKINLDFKPARDHIIKAAKYWLDIGFDGYRLDHVLGPSHNFWKEFSKEIKKDFPDAVLIGEACMINGIRFNELKTLRIRRKFVKWLSWHLKDNSDSLMKEYVNELDGVLDFRFRSLIEKFAEKRLDEKQLIRKLDRHYKKYPDNFFLPSFLDNHDVDRFLFLCRNDKEMLKKAAEIQLSIPQPPVIYYGTEVGLTQAKSINEFPSHGDLQARKPMEWENQDKELLNFYKRIIKERKNRAH